MIKKPYISFVVTARNDNYGVNFLGRLENFTKVLAYLWSKYNLDAELIIVEWNPPSLNPRLIDSLNLPVEARGRVRFIEVSENIHRTLPNAEKMPIFEYLAKNTGIRRAKGEFVIATNPDLLYGDNLIRFLAKRKLSENSFYRTDRYDFNGPLSGERDIEEKIRLAEQRVFKVETLGGTIPINPNSRLPFWVKLLLGHVKYKKASRKSDPNRLENKLHTNAAGDFFLMSKLNWLSLKGYPELYTHSLIDSYMCCLAKARGLEQVILDKNKRLFHQEHERQTSGRPESSYQEWVSQCSLMLKEGCPIIQNKEDWGLGNYNLPETVF